MLFSKSVNKQIYWTSLCGEEEKQIFVLSTAYKIAIMIPLISLSGLQILEFLSSPGNSQSSGGWTANPCAVPGAWVKGILRWVASTQWGWGTWAEYWQALSILEIWKHEKFDWRVNQKTNVTLMAFHIILLQLFIQRFLTLLVSGVSSLWVQTGICQKRTLRISSKYRN